MMNSDQNLNFDETNAPPEQAPPRNSVNSGNGINPLSLTNDSEGANYMVEEGDNYNDIDGNNGSWGNPPDEAVHYDEGPRDGVADGADPMIYDEHYANEPHDAYEDPYAEQPYPDEYDDPYANTPYATDEGGQYVHDPYGELDYSGRPTDDDLVDIDVSHRGDFRDPENLHGGHYELESKDPKSKGLQAFLQRYGKQISLIGSFTCLGGVLAAIILVASGAGGNSDPRVPHHKDGSLSPWGHRHDQVHTGAFVPPPLALETTCTQENIATQGGFNDCTGLCEPAQCCRFDPMAAPHMSCQRGHVQDCHTYHHYCERPPKAAVIPFTPPPTNIHEVCTKEKMHTPAGVTACARACQGGTCCRYPTTLQGLSCLRGNEAECQTYHLHCEQPPSEAEEAKDEATGDNGVNFPFVAPPGDISMKCAGNSVATAMGFEECLEICRSGTCCRFDPDREPSLSCRAEEPADCPIYDQYCGGNTEVIAQKPVHPNGETGISGDNPESATYVEKVCSDHSLATVEGFADCAQACNEHECCWKKDFGTTCPAGTHCKPYAHCLAMEASDHLDVAVQVAINTKCTVELVATVTGRKDCLFACSQATCCFGNTAGECPQANDSFCNQYEACEKIMQHEDIPPAPSNLNQQCQRENLNTLQGLAECDRACSKAMCCWKESGDQPSCLKTNPLCSDYAACFILDEGTIVETSPPVPSAPPALPTVCSATDGDVTACKEFCDKAECCWKTGKCAHEQNEQCKDYTPCATLLGDIEDAPEHLENVCKKELVATGPGKAACESVCDLAPCCWKTGACLGTHPAQCQGYISCSVLYAFTGTQAPLAAAPELLRETCTATNVANADGEMLCADVCKPAECCWKTGACLGSEPEICEGYVPCAALLNGSSSGSGTSAIADAPASLQNTCTRGKVSTANGLDDCVKACEAAECCWKTGSCLGSNPYTCAGYIPCAVLMDGTVSAAAPSDIGDVCIIDKIATVEGAAACEAMCEAADCCWKTGSCLGSQPEICEGYVPCAVLSGNNLTPAPLPSAPSFLKDVCTRDKVQNVEGAILCQDACKPAECCWKSGTCLGTYPDQCEGYVPCGILSNDAGTEETGSPVATVPKVPTYLSTVCGSQIAGDEVHGHLCLNACLRADCCWNPSSLMPCTNDPNCDSGYDICANVNFNTIVPPTPAPVSTPAPAPGVTPAPQPAPTQPPQSSGSGGDQAYTEEMITDVCLNHDNTIVNLCAKVCTPSDCCFDRNGDSGESCPEAFPCYKYSSCSILHQEDDYVDTACSSEDLSDCVAACGDSTCCFTNDIDKTCAVTNPNIICSRYTACEKLYGF